MESGKGVNDIFCIYRMRQLVDLSHFFSLVSTNKRQLNSIYDNANLHIIESGRELDQLIHTICLSRGKGDLCVVYKHFHPITELQLYSTNSVSFPEKR